MKERESKGVLRDGERYDWDEREGRWRAMKRVLSASIIDSGFVMVILGFFGGNSLHSSKFMVAF